MIIERFLNPKELKRYRAWKQDVRSTLKLWLKMLGLAWRNGGLRRLVDTDFYPIFLCGIAGSGTTLIGGLLDQNYESGLCIHVSDRMHETDRALWMEKSFYYDDLDEYYQDLIRPRKLSHSRI